MEASGSQYEKKGVDVACDISVAAAHHTPRKKRKRKHSGEGDHAKHHHGGKHGHRPPTKKFKHSFAMSSTKIANNIMKFRLGGSVSDPLNLEGDVSSKLGDDCSTCAPSPVGPEVFGQPSPLPFHLQHDPLNLEGKSEDFPANKTNKHTHHGLHHHNKHGKPGHKKKHSRRRTISKTEDHEKQEVGGATSSDKTTTVTKPPPNFNSKKAKFRYGNYDRYYGYRNSGIGEEDIRLSMLKGEWFAGKDCLDIGSNTGQVTVSIARKFSPRKIVGIDIDNKLVRMAWKNLHRDFFPALAPDGRPFPVSLTQSRDPVTYPLPLPTHCTTEGEERKDDDGTGNEGQAKLSFPHNIKFIHGNYVPSSDSALANQEPEYDVILALSLTKWIHLNWGDNGIKRFFRKVYLHLRPGGMFIVEPQPFTSYSKKKNVSAEVYENYQQIQFQPDQFHSYLMSPEVGFVKHKFIGIPQNKSKGFRRPLHMYFKAESVGVATHAQSTADSGDNSPSEETGRLKSVVQVVGQEKSASTECEAVQHEAGDTTVEDMETVGGGGDDGEGERVEGESGEP